MSPAASKIEHFKWSEHSGGRLLSSSGDGRRGVLAGWGRGCVCVWGGVQQCADYFH